MTVESVISMENLAMDVDSAEKSTGLAQDKSIIIHQQHDADLDAKASHLPPVLK